jgi:tRNA(fMet)-specific endonuclease VapC
MRPGGGPPGLARRLGLLGPEEQCTSSITVGELLYGALRVQSQRLEREIEELLGSGIRLVGFDEHAARVYAQLRVDLEAEGQRLGDADLRIAAICVAHDLTLVSGNVRHFERVPGLRVENWLE